MARGVEGVRGGGGYYSREAINRGHRGTVIIRGNSVFVKPLNKFNRVLVDTAAKG